MSKPCTQCNGTGSYPPFTRQVCSKCQGSMVEPEEKDNSIIVDRGIYHMSDKSWKSDLEGGGVVIGKPDTPFDIFNFKDIEGIFNHISEHFKLPVKLIRLMCDACDFDFYIDRSYVDKHDVLKCPVCSEIFVRNEEDDQEDEEE